MSNKDGRVDQQRYFTNDRSIQTSDNHCTVKISHGYKFNQDDVVDIVDAESDDSILLKEQINAMSPEQYERYLKEKNDTSIFKKIGNIVGTIGGSLFMNLTPKLSEQNIVYLNSLKEITLQQLNCKTIRSAFEKYSSPEYRK